MAAPRDTMTEYIRQLLELDEGRRRETLQSLSQYAETKCGNGMPIPGPSPQPRAPLGARTAPAAATLPITAPQGGAEPSHKSPERQRLQQVPSAGAVQGSGGPPCDTKAASTEGEELSLRSYLKYLQQLSSGRILLARRINRLGFDSADVLAAHFARYGRVAHVFVPRSRSVARSQSHRPFVRRRPSGIGFVVMDEDGAVDAIFQDGETHCVAGVAVQLQRFQRQSAALCEEEEDAGVILEDDTGS